MYLLPLLLPLLLTLLTACDPVESPRTESGLSAVTLAPTGTPAPTASPTVSGWNTLIPPTPTDPRCSADEVARILQHMPTYVPGAGSFLALDADGFITQDGERFTVRGVNYYPARAPFQRFTGSDRDTITADFDLLHAANINTLRLFVRYEGLFICPDSGAVPDPSAVLWLDSVIRLASARGLRMILVLHDLPNAPFYADPSLALAQTAFLITRYRDEPAILAWDLRDGGDQDYAPTNYQGDPLPEMIAPVSRKQVLDWLARTAAAVRKLDPLHPITAGWRFDAEATISLVDFVSFQHYGDAQTLRERTAALRSLTDKPLLVIALGASTYGGFSEIEQAQRLRETVRAVEGDRLAGWLVWTVYDFPTEVTCWPDPCASLDDIRHHFGLWRADGSRKPAANALETLAAGR
ncbi:MAG: cellulase family glycosylhydrolase [Anaerolineae bacterium]|nr:cellulase family glycosylhydrolase [Anaerolineae bacterium]